MYLTFGLLPFRTYITVQELHNSFLPPSPLYVRLSALYLLGLCPALFGWVRATILSSALAFFGGPGYNPFLCPGPFGGRGAIGDCLLPLVCYLFVHIYCSLKSCRIYSSHCPRSTFVSVLYTCSAPAFCCGRHSRSYRSHPWITCKGFAPTATLAERLGVPCRYNHIEVLRHCSLVISFRMGRLWDAYGTAYGTVKEILACDTNPTHHHHKY